eukprot:Gb_03516 [translate_table: standard]
MLRSQWLRSQSIPRSEYNWSLKRTPCEKTGVDSIVAMCAKEEVDTHEGVVKAMFLRTRISLMGCLPKEFGVELANSEDFIATLSNFLGGVFMTQTNKSTQCESIPSSIQNSIQDISGSSEDIDVPGATLDDGIVQSEQNKIRERLYLNNLIDGGPLNLDVKQIYPPSHNPTHMQIRLPHKLHVQNIKTLLRNKPRAHVVNLLVLVDPEEVSSKNEFDRSRANFDYHYYVIGGCHSIEARRQLAQEFPQNVHFKEVKCIVYAGLTPLEVKVLAWDHNHDNEYRAKMTFIQKNCFFHNEFIDLCEGDKSKATFKFQLQCCMDVGYVWDLIDSIFSMWDEFKVKGQKVKKMKKDLYSCSSSKSIPTLLPLPDDMSPSPWRCLQGIKDEKILISVISRVKSTDLSLNEMAEEFTNHKVYMKIQEHMARGLNCLSWEEVTKRYPESSSMEALQPYFIAFRNVKTKKKGENFPVPKSFKAHIERAKMERSRRVQSSSIDYDDSLHHYVWDTLHTVSYATYNGDCDWVLDLFSGSGTTIACSLKKGRNCISVEKDLIQVNYINQRVNALSQLPDEFQEVCFKEGNIDSNKVVMCSMEPQPPLGNLIGKEHYGELANIEDPLSRSIVVTIPNSIEEVVGSMHEIDPTPFDDEQGLLDYIDK